jgi:CRISPR-associated protein Cas1
MGDVGKEALSRLQQTVAPMVKRTLEISQQPAHLALRLGQLQLRREGDLLASIPCEDLGVVIVDHPQATYSHAALTELARQDAVVVFCGPNHLPCGMLLPISNHNLVVSRLRLQMDMAKPIQKRLWQQLIKAKILAQAENFADDTPISKRLTQLAADVRSGDPDNREAVAAKSYWSAWLMQAPEAALPLDGFRRDPKQEGVNSLLNYGYAIVRACLARAIIAAGLQPAIGIHHSNRSNAFCLADDLIEPLRPLVDAKVRELAFEGETELTQPVKAQLLDLLTEEVRTGEETGPLSVAMQRYVISLVKVLEKESKELRVPIRCALAVTVECG